MRSNALDILPPKVRRSLAKLGSDIAIARRKRSLTALMMAERLGVSKSTYLRVERGDPTVSMGIYAMALFALGAPEVLGNLLDVRQDDVGLLLDLERLPKRVRAQGGATLVRRSIQVYLGDTPRRIGTLRFDQQGARESASFEYHADREPPACRQSPSGTNCSATPFMQ